VLSLSKLLVLAAIVFAVWYAFNYFRRLGQQQQRRSRSQPPPRGYGQKRDGSATAAGGNAGAVEELTPCPRCGTYVAARGSAAPCNRPDCPWRT
jgi:hypothetical protein